MEKNNGVLFVLIVSVFLVAIVIFAATVQEHRYKARLAEATARISALEVDYRGMDSTWRKVVGNRDQIIEGKDVAIQTKSSEINFLEEKLKQLSWTMRAEIANRDEVIKKKEADYQIMDLALRKVIADLDAVINNRDEIIKKLQEVTEKKEADYQAMDSTWRKVVANRDKIIEERSGENNDNKKLSDTLRNENKRLADEIWELYRTRYLTNPVTPNDYLVLYYSYLERSYFLDSVTAFSKKVKPVLLIPANSDFSPKRIANSKQAMENALRITSYWFFAKTGRTFAVEEPIVINGEKTIDQYELPSIRQEREAVLPEVKLSMPPEERGEYLYVVFVHGKQSNTNSGWQNIGAILNNSVLLSIEPDVDAKIRFAAISIMAHELGHVFGLGDLYAETQTIMRLKNNGDVYYVQDFPNIGFTEGETILIRDYLK